MTSTQAHDAQNNAQNKAQSASNQTTGSAIIAKEKPAEVQADPATEPWERNKLA